MRPFRLFVCLAVSTLAGCYSTSIAQVPSTVPPGKLRWGIGMEVDRATAHPAAARDSSLEGLSPELSVRVGVLERVDFGVKSNLQSFEGQVKGQILRGDFDLSVALSAAVSREEQDPLIIGTRPQYDLTRNARLMLVAGQRVVDSIDLVLMGDGQYGVRSGKDSGVAWSQHFVGVGGGVGVLLKGHVQFLPEIVVTQFVVGQDSPHPAMQAGDTRIQLTVTALLGGEEERDPP